MTESTRRFVVLVFVLLASAAATAQRTTWIVDRSGAPGSHFADLPDAVGAAAVLDGDVLLVRSGSYSRFSTSKALTVLGEGNVVVTSEPVSAIGEPAIDVFGLGADESFVMKNLEVKGPRFFIPVQERRIHLRDSGGRIHLEHVSCPAPSVSIPGVALEISDCRQVTVSGGVLVGTNGLRASRSTVSVASATIIGLDVVRRHTVCLPRAQPGVLLQDSIAYLSRTDVRGGNGDPHPFVLFGQCDPSPAIVATGGVVTITGDSSTMILAGTVRFPGDRLGPIPTPAISASTAIVDTQVQLLVPGGGPTTQGGVTFRRVVSLRATGAPLGGVVVVEVVCPAGDPFALLVARPATPLETPFGLLFVDPLQFVASGLATQGPSEHFGLTIPVPVRPELHGEAFTMQAVHFDRSRAELVLSNPTTIVLH